MANYKEDKKDDVKLVYYGGTKENFSVYPAAFRDEFEVKVAIEEHNLGEVAKVITPYGSIQEGRV